MSSPVWWEAETDVRPLCPRKEGTCSCFSSKLPNVRYTFFPTAKVVDVVIQPITAADAAQPMPVSNVSPLLSHFNTPCQSYLSKVFEGTSGLLTTPLGRYHETTTQQTVPTASLSSRHLHHPSLRATTLLELAQAFRGHIGILPVNQALNKLGHRLYSLCNLLLYYPLQLTFNSSLVHERQLAFRGHIDPRLTKDCINRDIDH